MVKLLSIFPFSYFSKKIKHKQIHNLGWKISEKLFGRKLIDKHIFCCENSEVFGLWVYKWGKCPNAEILQH